MHSIWTRANTLFAFTLSVLSAAILLAFASTIFFANTTTVTLNTSNPRIKTMSDYTVDEGESDMAMLSLNIEADLSSIFNWNVKQLYVYLVAEYSTTKNVLNQVTLWDKIVLRSDPQVILEQSIHPKYYFLDDGTNLLGHENVTLVLKWNIVPNAGYLAMAEGQGKHIVKFPSEYVSGRF